MAPSAGEAKDDYIRSVEDSTVLLHDAVSVIGSYSGPPGYYCDTVQFTWNGIVAPIADATATTRYLCGFNIWRRIKSAGFDISASTGTLGDFTWNDIGDVPGYSVFDALYQAYRPLGATLFVRNMSSYQENEGAGYGARIARVDNSLLDFDSLSLFQQNGQMQDFSPKLDFAITTVPSDLQDVNFVANDSTADCDGAICLLTDVDQNSRFSVKRVWTVIGLRKVNYMVGYNAALNASFEEKTFLRQVFKMNDEDVRHHKRMLKLLPLEMTDEVVSAIQAYDALSSVGRDLKGEALVQHREYLCSIGETEVPLPKVFATSLWSEDGKIVEWDKLTIAQIRQLWDIYRLNELNDTMSALSDFPPGRDPFKAPGGFLSSIASMISPSTVKNAVDIISGLPVIQDVAQPVNETAKMVTGKDLGQLAANGYKWARDGGL